MGGGRLRERERQTNRERQRGTCEKESGGKVI